MQKIMLSYANGGAHLIQVEEDSDFGSELVNTTLSSQGVQFDYEPLTPHYLDDFFGEGPEWVDLIEYEDLVSAIQEGTAIHLKDADGKTVSIVLSQHIVSLTPVF